MTRRAMAERLPGGALILREAPLRFVLSAVFFFAIPALCLLFPALLESPNLLALIVILAGGTTVLLLHLSRRTSGIDLRVSTPKVRRETTPAFSPRWLFVEDRDVETTLGGLAPVALSLTPSPRDRLLFILEDLEVRLPSRERDVVREIRESWAQCFEDHVRAVEDVRAVSRRRPYALYVGEENLLIGSLFEETFKDLGFPVDRIPWSRTMRMREEEKVLQVSADLRWLLDENYVLSATPVRRRVSARLSEGRRWIPMRRLGESPQALVELVPPLAEPLSGEFADAFSRWISRVLVAATHLKRSRKAAG